MNVEKVVFIRCEDMERKTVSVKIDWKTKEEIKKTFFICDYEKFKGLWIYNIGNYVNSGLTY